MPRVKRGVIHLKKRRSLKKRTKGFLWGRKKNMRVMHTAILKSGVQAYKGRRLKKRDFRSLHTIRLNAAVRELGLTYSAFIGAMHKKGIELDRKTLSDLAMKYPEVLKKIVEAVK